MNESTSRLSAVIDAVPLADDAARALWLEFSAHMEAHRGDMVGFARKKGWFSVVPEHRQGKAVLLVKTHAAAPVPKPPQPAKPVKPAKAAPKPRPKAKPPGKAPQKKRR